MGNLEKTCFDIDELAKKIEEKIKELEAKEEEYKKEQEYKNEDLGENIANLDEIIKEIDKRIAELEDDEEGEDGGIDIEDLTNKVNAKLSYIDEVDVEDDLGRTRYDLEEISKQINNAIKALEDKRKEKKRKKAMYCDMARKKNSKKKVSNKKQGH